MSIKAVRAAVKKANKDTFDVGTVIRWTSGGKYTYTAVKTPVGWFTSAQHFNTYVPQVVKFDELLEILARSETSEVAVATAWDVIS